MFCHRWVVLLLVIQLVVYDVAEARARMDVRRLTNENDGKQALFVEDGEETRETNAPNFVRLVLMRLIYGLAAQMGFEDRLEGVFNGAFVPPNAEDDFGVLDDVGGIADLGGIGDLGGLGDIAGIGGIGDIIGGLAGNGLLNGLGGNGLLDAFG